MDFLGETPGGRRRVNLSGSAPSAASRAEGLEAARRERERRSRERRREQAAQAIQSWWRNRHLHAAERIRQRAVWDAELVQLATSAQSGGAGLPARLLQRAVARFMFFARIAPRRPCDATVPPARQSATSAALEVADRTRLRQLAKLMLSSMRSNDRQQHFGALIVGASSGYRVPPAIERSAASVAAARSAPLPALPFVASHWLYQTRKLILLLLQQIGDPTRHPMDAHVSNDIFLLWMLLDSNQWPWVKAGQATAEEKAMIQLTQSALVGSLVTDSAYGRPVPSSAPVAASSSAAPAAPARSTRPAQPSIDLFHCLRTRMLDLTLVARDNAPTPAQVQNKTSVALMFAIVIRCVTLTTQASPAGTAASSSSADLSAWQRIVLTSFVYHIFSIPALAHRLRMMGLEALLRSFIAPPVFDRSMETLTREVRRVNLREPAGGSLSFARGRFASFSHTWYDTASQATGAATLDRAHASRNHMEIDSPSAAASSASAVAAASSSTAAAAAASSTASPSSPSSPFPRSSSTEPTVLLSGVAWLLGNCLDLLSLLDESKSATASLSFSYGLAAIEQLIQAVPERELPVLGNELPAGHELSASQSVLPPVYIKQLALFGERAFLDRLCKRLLAEPSLSSSSSHVADASVSMQPGNAAPPSPLNDVPIICVLIDSLLFRCGTASTAILNTLVFSTGIVKPLWVSIQRSGLLARIETAGKAPAPAVPASSSSRAAALSSSSFSAASSSSSAAAAASSSSPPPLAPLEHVIRSDRFFQLLPLFCTLYGHLLVISDDQEFFEAQKPFSLREDVAQMVAMLKGLLYHLYWTSYSTVGTPARLRERFSKLFVQLRDRQSRRSFLPPESWLFTAEGPNAIPIHIVQQELQAESQQREEMTPDNAELLPPGRSAALIASIPFVLPFSDRVKLLYAHIDLDKIALHRSGVQFAHGMGRRVNIRRSHILEDAFDALGTLSGNELKGRVQVQFIDEHGLEEAGLDGGGLFKEALTTLMARAFDPASSLWTETPDHFLYPNPQALDLPLESPLAEEDAAMDAVELAQEHAQDALQYFRFIGAMVGKALYDGIQIESQFALFFLRSLVGLRNYLDDLRGLDEQIYRSLVKLKAIHDPEEIASLGLTFSIDRQVYGTTRSVELIPGGADVAVTAANKVRFIYAMSDFYLSRQIARQTHAFQQGLWSLVPAAWLRMFAAEELRLLISGSPRVNLADLRAHTHYSSGYSPNHETIKLFWEVLEEFEQEQVAQLLRFCTSCSRAPLLGFQFLSPGFCIQRVNADELEQNLPTAATCMNLLRLPRYTTKQRLKEKLIYAITTASHGFGLT